VKPRMCGTLPGLLAPIVALCTGAPAYAERLNLLFNGDFEGTIRADGTPAGWTTYVPTGKATFRLDTASAHAGGHCLLLETPGDMKASLVSAPMPVAPGEKLALTVWCRVDKLATTSSGTLTLNAGFLDGHKRYFRWAKGQPAPPPAGQWMQLKLDAEVPEDAAYVTFQLGHAMMTGATRWDDASLTVDSPVALRFAMESGQCGPGRQELPLVLINREPSRAGRAVEVWSAVSPGPRGLEETALQMEPGGGRLTHTLGRQPEERITVPVDLHRRGKQKLAIVVRAGSEVLATAQRLVTVPPLLVAEPLLPTHWCIEDGAPKIEGRVWVHEEAARRKRMRLTCVLRNGSQVLAETKLAQLPANPVAYTFALRSAPLGDYAAQITLHDGDTEAARAEQDWHVIHRAQAEVRVGADGYLRVEGKPFFPIGIFNGSRFAEQAAAGFNVTHGYNAMAMGPADAPNHQRAKDFLDASHRAGMKTLMLVSHGLGTGRRLDDEVVRRVRMFRNHPGLLAWDEEEGVARGEAPPSYVKDLYAMLRREAPEHPLMIGDSYDVIHKVDRTRLFPEQHMDLGMWWWYPFPLTPQPGGRAPYPPGGRDARPPSQSGDALQGEEVTAGTELVAPTFLTMATTKKPIWLGIQAYRKPERRDGRFPTPTEYRAQAYIGIIHGARGLMYYVGSGSGGNGIFNKPEEGHWVELKKLVTELREMAPVFMLPDSPAQVKAAPSAAISTRLKETPAGLVLLAANRSDQPAEVTFVIEGVPAGAREVVVRYENRTVKVDDGLFADRFGGYGVHVYELPRD